MGDTTSTSEEKRFRAIFDEVMLRQLRKLGEDASLQLLLSQMLDKMELLGPRAGKLIDSHCSSMK